MFAKILIALAIIVVVFIVVVALQAPTFRVERSTTIAAPPSEVFGRVNDLHKFQDWSPWAKMDPDSKVTFDGPPAGTGASFSWAGNNKVGEGRMTITDSRPNELARMKLDFIKPFAATNTAEFSFKPDGSNTVITWSMFGDKNFFSKAFGLFLSMDKMIGGDFEKGLANLKALSETATK